MLHALHLPLIVSLFDFLILRILFSLTENPTSLHTVHVYSFFTTFAMHHNSKRTNKSIKFLKNHEYTPSYQKL
jgi:hypothetical protein